MGKGRKPCCDKAGVKKGPWSQAEDFKLMSFIQKHGHSNWRALPRLAGLARCGKSCRLRWVNYLRPDLKRGHFTSQEEEAIIKLHEELGNKWSKIASCFPGRTDNEIKNVWNTHLKKRLKATQSTKTASESCNNLPTSTLTSEVLDEISNKDCSEKVPLHQTSTLDEPSSSSCTSYVSQASLSDHQMEVTNPILDVLAAPSSNMVDQDCDNPIENSLEELIEIPFEPDLDLWDLLDGGQFNSTDYSDQGHETDTPLCPISEKDTANYVTSSKEEDGGSWWWLVYLENELGLAHNEAISPQSTIGSNDHELFKGEETYFRT